MWSSSNSTSLTSSSSCTTFSARNLGDLHGTEGEVADERPCNIPLTRRNCPLGPKCDKRKRSARKGKDFEKIFFSRMTESEGWRKGEEEKSPFIGIGQMTQAIKSCWMGNEWLRLSRNDRRWAFKRHSKYFEINGQDGSSIMGRRDTRVLKALFMGKCIASQCAADSQKLK